MRINQIGFNGKTVVILGAGATRGEKFVEKKSGVLPPLDKDFFTQAQRLSPTKAKQGLEGLISDVSGLLGPNFKVTMEGYLTLLQQLDSVEISYRLEGRPPERKPYKDMRTRFIQVLAAVIHEAIYEATKKKGKCEYHEHLVECLDSQDTILSLNYDCLIDYALKNRGKGKWNPRIGYGLKAYKAKKGTKYWAFQENKQEQYPDETVKLLKLHGSLTWAQARKVKNESTRRLELKERWWHQRGNVRCEITPPEWNKSIQSSIYVPVWREARRALLKQAKALVFIGYSLPTTDLPFHALLRIDEKKAENLSLLVVVNPDPEARNRIRQVVLHRINDQTRVLSFEKFEEFSKFLCPPSS
jgi:hypothetical protein